MKSRSLAKLLDGVCFIQPLGCEKPLDNFLQIIGTTDLNSSKYPIVFNVLSLFFNWSANVNSPAVSGAPSVAPFIYAAAMVSGCRNRSSKNFLVVR